MTETQLLTILGTMWIAPHVNKYYAQITGLIFLIVCACKGLGWI
jgi:ABC-type uncharacterized transport system permease subunit